MRVHPIAPVLASICLALVCVPTSAAAAAAPLACGATITQSTTLTADVGPCAGGDGLVITSSNITLNLGGHRVLGAGVQSTNNDVGVLLLNVSRVTVAGPGSVSHFSAGVAIFGGQQNTVRDVFSHDNNSTQWANDNPDLAVYGDGIAVNSSSYNIVENNTVSANGPFAGISVFTSLVGNGNPPPQVGNTFRNNVVKDNDVPDVCTSSGQYYGGPCTPGEAVFNEDIGIRVEGPAAVDSTVSGNTVTGSGRDGISVLNINGPSQNRNMDARIVHNTSDANGTARVITDPQVGQLGGAGFFNRCFHATPFFGGSYVPDCPTGTVLIGNTFDNNPGQGLSIDASIDATVIGNSAHGNGFGTQTAVDEDPPYTDAMDYHTPPCDTNTYLGNSFGTVNDPCLEHNVAVVHGAGSGSPIHQAPRLGGRAVIQ